MKLLILFFFIISNLSFAKRRVDPVKEVFPTLKKTVVIKVKDTISENPINDKIYKAFNSNGQLLGYYRKIITTTGCNSACLPITATLFYGPNKTFKTIKSKKGLTKKGHAPFTSHDYNELELLLNLNPDSFKSVSHPKDMVDVITGQTTKKFQGDVVKEAAYTSLRLNKYNQDTLKKLREHKAP